jgi:hypothetical protein
MSDLLAAELEVRYHFMKGSVRRSDLVYRPSALRVGTHLDLLNEMLCMLPDRKLFCGEFYGYDLLDQVVHVGRVHTDMN